MQILGRSDRVDLPGLGLKGIHAKIDTGAYNCSLHCSQVSVVNGRLEFVLLDEEHPEFTGRPFRVKKFEQREIKNSFGEAELRYLSNRGNLKFPVLIGRKTLRHRFLIDVTKTDLSFMASQAAPPSAEIPGV
jgi:hypothetical protein